MLDWRGQQFLSYFDRGGVRWAIGFYPFPADRTSRLGSLAEQIIKGVASRIIPLLQPSNADWSELAAGKFTEAVLRQYLQPQGPCQGVGEVPFYKTPLQGLALNDPIMQTIYQVVNETKSIVMLHFSNPKDGGHPSELAEAEAAIKKYPDAIFLLHSMNTIDMITQLMTKYPNVYYSMDFASAYYRGPGVSLYPADPNLDNAASFLAGVNRTDMNSIVERNLRDLAPLLQKYPDRIFWGTDLDAPWHYEEAVTDMVLRISRLFIGRLPADVQEKYAFQNAQRVFGRFLTHKP